MVVKVSSKSGKNVGSLAPQNPSNHNTLVKNCPYHNLINRGKYHKGEEGKGRIPNFCEQFLLMCDQLPSFIGIGKIRRLDFRNILKKLKGRLILVV